MNTTNRLLRAFKNPKLFARGINRIYHRRAGFRSENPSGQYIFEEDWDNLVVLDACRYDMFESNNTINGDLTSKESLGSSTVEWLRANFHSRDLQDTVYVTANPQLERNRDKWDISLCEVINVWIDEGWDKDKGTVLAETMTDAAIEAHKRFPHKRIIIHYMQPHYPFVPSETDFDKEHLSSINDKDDSLEGENVWNQKFMGELSIPDDELWSMYTENLEYALGHIKTLLSTLSGKTVITSDHGNYVGERASPNPIREYGHPRGLYDEPLTRVPWLVCEFDERRTITADDSSIERNGPESDVVAERLRDLGYRSP